MSKKKLLTYSVALMGLAGLVILFVPFAQSMLPTTKAVDAATINVDISSIKPGDYKQVAWQGKPVVVYRVNSEVVKSLEALNEQVWGPNISADNFDEVYVYIPVSTYLGCSLAEAKGSEFEEKLPSGWWDPCHMGAWDYAGRTYKELYVPKGMKLDNLQAVNYRVLKDGWIQLHP